MIKIFDLEYLLYMYDFIFIENNLILLNNNSLLHLFNLFILFILYFIII